MIYGVQIVQRHVQISTYRHGNPHYRSRTPRRPLWVRTQRSRGLPVKTRTEAFEKFNEFEYQ